MTLIKLLGLFIAAVCTVVGYWVYGNFGLPGLAVGIFAAISVFFIPFIICDWTDRVRHHKALEAYFGRYWSRDRSSAWAALPEKFAGGDAVSGKVVNVFYHGVIVDIGCGFPARLGFYWSTNGFEGPRLITGDQVSARIREFDAGERFIELTQVRRRN